MRSAQISFQAKKVMIIGGGRLAFKKGCQFQSEGAEVIYLAPTLCEEIKKETHICKMYEASDLDNAFLVYACTDDKKINHQVVLEANRNGMLSASVHQDKDATYHPLQSCDLPHLHVALSTNGTYPAYINEIMEEIIDRYETIHHDVLEELKNIRDYVLKLGLAHHEKRMLLKAIGSASHEQIHFYAQAIQSQKVTICIFHGNTSIASSTMITHFLKQIECGYTLYYAYLKSEDKQVLSLETIHKHMRLLQIKECHYQPMILEMGHCYHLMQQQLDEVETLLVDEISLPMILEEYSDCEQGLIVIHDSSMKQLYNALINLCPKHLHVMMLSDEIPKLDYNRKITLYGMFMLAGKHLLEDVMSEVGIYGKLINLGYTVQRNETCLLQLASFKTLFEKQLQEKNDKE